MDGNMCEGNSKGKETGDREGGREVGTTYHAGEGGFFVLDAMGLVDDDIPPLDLLQGRSFLWRTGGREGREGGKGGRYT